MIITDGDLVYFYADERRAFLKKATAGASLHTDLGYLDITTVIGKQFGEIVETNLGKSFYLLKPTLHELIMKLKRRTQIMYPKDIGLILTRANIFPGARVIESGIGSGGLTTALANFVRPSGRVYSYERNPEFLANAKKNLEKNGLDQWVEFKHREVTDSYDEEEVDFVMIDIGSQWDLIDAARGALKAGCQLSTICPTFEQLTRTVFTLEEKGFININTIEVLVRRILVRRGKTRPEQQMPSHTGWLVFATKIIPKIPEKPIEPLTP